MDNLQLEPRLQKLVDIGESGTNILHGELKNLMYETEKVMLAIANDEPLAEDEYDESDEYLQGRLTALSDVYQLTYALSFAISDRMKNNA